MLEQGQVMEISQYCKVKRRYEAVAIDIKQIQLIQPFHHYMCTNLSSEGLIHYWVSVLFQTF